MKITIRADDRLLAGAAGVAAGLAGVAALAYRFRGSARVQAATAALLGRPVAYRLHLHGTGIELAPWEKNVVAECVIRRAPESGIRIGPVKPRADEGGSLVRDTHVENSGTFGVHLESGWPGEDGPADDPDLVSAGAEVSSAEDATARYWLPAECPSGHHVFDAERAYQLGGRASITLRTPVRVVCPECGEDAFIQAGRYTVSGGEVVREDLPAEDAEEPGEAGEFR